MITQSKKISTHFHSNEFKCPHCGQIKIDENLIIKVEHLFTKLNASKCIVSSGYRCPEYDRKENGFAGKHSEGLAMDCVFYDKNNKIIPSKIVICVAYDLKELKGIALINDKYIHLDNRSNSSYYGDETRGNSSYWTNPYIYFNISNLEVEKYTSLNKITYQSHGKNKYWYPNVVKGSNDYAGVLGISMDGIKIDNLTYKVKVNKTWLPEIKGRSDYAGILGKDITDIAIKNATYRVHVKGEKWLDWVNGYDIHNYQNGYAGNGKVIDALQLK